MVKNRTWNFLNQFMVILEYGLYIKFRGLSESLEAFPVDDRGAWFIIFCLCNPHLFSRKKEISWIHTSVIIKVVFGTSSFGSFLKWRSWTKHNYKKNIENQSNFLWKKQKELSQKLIREASSFKADKKKSCSITIHNIKPYKLHWFHIHFNFIHM